VSTMSFKKKKTLARRMTTIQELKKGVSVWNTAYWNARKERIAKRLARNTDVKR
jgi:RNA-binding protein YlmH